MESLDSLTALKDAAAAEGGSSSEDNNDNSVDLQDQKDELDGLEEQLLNGPKAAAFKAVMEMGEILLSTDKDHLTPNEGQAGQNDLAHLKSQWKLLNGQVQSLSKSVEASLQQFAEFSGLRERLARWLREIEYAMQEHTKLRPTLEEKKGQLQSHKIIHKDITSRYSICLLQHKIPYTGHTALVHL